MQLEDELGVTLFIRSKRHITLTEDGLLLRRRAEELVSLAEKTIAELSHHNEELSGTIAIGSGEYKGTRFLAELIASFQAAHPAVQFMFYSGNADDIKERIEHGLLDLGLLQEPVEISRYSFVRLPIQEVWGAYIPKGHPLAKKTAVSPEDLADQPLILPERESVRHELENWFGPYAENLHIIGGGNLLYNQTVFAWHFHSNVREPAVSFGAVPVLDFRRDDDDAAWLQTHRIFVFFLVPAAARGQMFSVRSCRKPSTAASPLSL